VPYPSPITYPSGLLYPGTDVGGGFDGSPVALGTDIVLNTIDADGVLWLIDQNGFKGWGSPGSTAEFTQRARGNGDTSSEGFLRGRVMTISGVFDAPTPELALAAADKLVAAVSLSGFTLSVWQAGSIRSCFVKRQDEVLIDWVDALTANYSIQIKAKDPRKFGDLVTASTRLPFSEGGLIRPSTWPRTWTGVSGTGKVTINNPGNTQAPAWLRIDGPLPAGGWTVTHQAKQTSLTFATSLALGSGEFVTVDMDRREVLAQGQAPRSGYVTSRGWFSLDPGDNVIAFSAANYSSTASLTVTSKPSWS
jgi:hypothetical protein